MKHTGFLSLGASYEKQASNSLATYTLSAEYTKKEDRTEIVKTICDDGSVLFYWTLANIDLDGEDKKDYRNL